MSCRPSAFTDRALALVTDLGLPTSLKAAVRGCQCVTSEFETRGRLSPAWPETDARIVLERRHASAGILICQPSAGGPGLLPEARPARLSHRPAREGYGRIPPSALPEFQSRKPTPDAS